MKRFIKFYQRDKQNVKMTNQSESGFDLIILNNEVLKSTLDFIKNCQEKSDEVYIVWQMKFKKSNFVLYKECTFSEPVINYFAPRKPVFNRFLPLNPYEEQQIPAEPCGQKIRVSCKSTAYYSDSTVYKNRKVTKDKYKDAQLLDRMLKISELNIKENLS